MNAQSGVVAAQRPLPRPSRHILIVGGGACGVLMAPYLPSQPDILLSVIMIGGRTARSPGIANAITGPDALLMQQIRRVYGGPERELLSDPH